MMAPTVVKMMIPLANAFQTPEMMAIQAMGSIFTGEDPKKTLEDNKKYNPYDVEIKLYDCGEFCSLKCKDMYEFYHK